MNANSKKSAYIIGGLFTTALGLFGYQNYYMPAQEEQNTAVVYIAATDIPTDTVLSAEMLKPVTVNEKSVLPGSITNVNEVVNKRLTGGILEGEMLFAQRISPELTEQGSFYVKVEPDYPVDLQDGDHVLVAAQDDKGELNDLFGRKQVYASSRVVNIVEGQAATGFYLLLTEEEMNDYYSSKVNDLVVMTKIDTVATDKDIENETNNVEPKAVELPKEETNTDETKKEAAKTNGTAGETSNLKYQVQKGETLESIAHELEVSAEELSAVNNGVDKVEAGDMINIP